MAKRRRQETDADIDRATSLFCDELEAVRTLRFGDRQMTGRYAAAKVRAAPLRERRLAGRRLLKRYRRDANCAGAIDWQKFHEWLKDHMAELTLLKIVLSVISILLIL